MASTSLFVANMASLKIHTLKQGAGIDIKNIQIFKYSLAKEDFVPLLVL